MKKQARRKNLRKKRKKKTENRKMEKEKSTGESRRMSACKKQDRKSDEIRGSSTEVGYFY